MGRSDYRRAGRNDPRAGAPDGGNPHDADRVVVAAARRPWRAALLGAGAAGSVPRPDRLAGRRVWLRLWFRRRSRRTAANVPRPGDAGVAQPGAARNTGGAHRRLPARSEEDTS